MRWDRILSVGVSVSIGLLAACEVHVRDGAAPAPPPPPRQVAVAARPAPPPPPAAHPAPPPPPVAAERKVVMLRLPGRVVHPPPAPNLVVHLNVQALRLKVRPNSKCGPRESTPGHWIHIDCNEYQPVSAAKPPSERKVKLMLPGGLKLDTPVSGALCDAVGGKR